MPLRVMRFAVLMAVIVGCSSSQRASTGDDPYSEYLSRVVRGILHGYDGVPWQSDVEELADYYPRASLFTGLGNPGEDTYTLEGNDATCPKVVILTYKDGKLSRVYWTAAPERLIELNRLLRQQYEPELKNEGSTEWSLEDRIRITVFDQRGYVFFRTLDATGEHNGSAGSDDGKSLKD